MKNIPWSAPSISEKDYFFIRKTLKSKWLTQGSMTSLLEKELAKKLGSKYVIMMNNGTSALIASLLANQIQPGDEVLVPSFTFISTINSILAIGAKPILVDSDPKTFNTDVEFMKNKITKKTKAILPVDVSGMPIDIYEIQKFADSHNLILIEDAAEGIGAEYKNKKIGSFDHTTVFSFHMAKVIAGIEGGCVTTNNKEVAERARLIRTHGDTGNYNSIIFGLNFRISDIHSAFALAQLKQLEKFLKHRQKLVKIYKDELSQIQFQSIPDYVTLHPYMLFAMLVNTKTRNSLRKFLFKNGVDTRICWPPTHKQPFHSNIFRNQKLPNSEKIFSQIINLPMGNGLSEKDTLFVATLLKKGLKSI